MKKLLLSMVLLGILFSGCTDKQKTRTFGGTEVSYIPSDRKLVMATWKNDSLWFLTRKRAENEEAEIYKFVEESSFGMMEGVVTIIEQ